MYWGWSEKGYRIPLVPVWTEPTGKISPKMTSWILLSLDLILNVVNQRLGGPNSSQESTTFRTVRCILYFCLDGKVRDQGLRLDTFNYNSLPQVWLDSLPLLNYRHRSWIFHKNHTTRNEYEKYIYSSKLAILLKHSNIKITLNYLFLWLRISSFFNGIQ